VRESRFFNAYRKELKTMAKAKICIIVGHGKSRTGGYDSGAVSKDKKYHEFKIAREIAKYAASALNAAGLECDLMNYEGNMYLTERIAAVNKKKYDFIAEIHLNAGGGKGTETYYFKGSPTGKKYAQAICKEIAAAFGVRNRGAKTRTGKDGKDYFAIIRDTKPCACLIETLFIDNDAELKMLITSAWQEVCGEAIAKAICELNGVKLEKTFKAGDAVKLNDTPLYTSSTNKAFAAKRTGTYFIYDGKDFSGRLRVTNEAAKCGKTPAALYVSGYVDKKDLM
jgi:N-acetylmuramoyl-L-alanine amidase